MTDDRLAGAELAALARARLDGLHGALDSSVDALPSCTPCGWCHTPASPAGAVLGDAQRSAARHEPLTPQ